MDNPTPTEPPRQAQIVPGDWPGEPFAPVPVRRMWESLALPTADRNVMLALYARRYESEPFARPLSLAEVAAAARLSPDRARLALLRRIRAGWVEEEIP